MATDSNSHSAHALALCRFIDDSPSPFHVADNSASALELTGFTRTGLDSDGSVGKFVAVVDGSVVAWVVPEAAKPGTPFRVVGAHTDSPNLHLKPSPDANEFGYLKLGVETYGGVLLNSWLDRDLGLSGRLAIRSGDSVEMKLVHISDPILRIPQLAIHLDHEINSKGLLLNKQAHMSPVYGLSSPESQGIMSLIAESVSVSQSDIVGMELMVHDTAPSQLIGANREFVSAPRLDNQLSCHAAVTALSGVSSSNAISAIVLFDHEEVGSVSATGAATSSLPRLLSSITASLGGSATDHEAALAESLFVSSDNAHATHPNYADRHDPNHHIALNGGPVLKFNANQRYTTNAKSEGLFRLAAERAGVQTQQFVSRSDLPCGSTIGPTVSAQLSMTALDVGCPQLAMHSCRELAGTNDPWELTLLLAELLS